MPGIACSKAKRVKICAWCFQTNVNCRVAVERYDGKQGPNPKEKFGAKLKILGCVLRREPLKLLREERKVVRFKCTK